MSVIITTMEDDELTTNQVCGIPKHCQKGDEHLIDSLDEPRLAVGAQALKLRESKWIGHELDLEVPDLRSIAQVLDHELLSQRRLFPFVCLVHHF